MKTKNKKKAAYKLKNWKEYNESLKQRGKLEIWISGEIADKWAAQPTGKPGNQGIYSDYAIEIVIQFGKIFKQKLRQTEGLLESIFKLMGFGLSVPDYSTVSKRAGKISVELFKKIPEKGGKKTVIIDSTGLKVYGEGEWKIKVHGKSKRRTWRKAHIVINPDGEIQVSELTENCEADCKVGRKLLNRINEDIDTVAGDGGYDKEDIYGVCRKRKIHSVLIPPQENAKIKLHGNLKMETHPRDENLRRIREIGRKKWKNESGYHVRSLVETTMFRLKTIVGGNLNFRKFENQITEFMVSCNILNRMNGMVRPDSYAVA